MDPAPSFLLPLLLEATDPAVFLPALALGWWCRSMRLVLAGALLIAALRLAMALTGPQMQGFEPVPFARPIGFLAPFALALGTHAMRRWTRGREQKGGAGIGPRLVRALLGMVLGLGLGFALGLVIGTAVVAAGRLGSSPRGADDIVGFAFILPGLLLGPILGGILGWFYPAARGRDAAEGQALAAQTAITWRLVDRLVPMATPILLGGLNPWEHAWRPRGEPPIMVPHPQYPDQRHRLDIFDMTDGRTVIRFAAWEFSNLAWGFYLPG